MLGRKRKIPETMEHDKKRRPRLKLDNAPEVNSLTDLINVGKTMKFYKNIDTVMLWNLLPHLEELNNMVGMESLKKTIFYQIIYYMQGMHTKNGNQEYLHTVIYGAPGTGKTTVAKIIGKIYQTMKILSPDGPIKIAYRDDFVAGYLGQTATKTRKLLNSCLGGVLFIDEVYSLAPRNNDRDSFSKEAIDTLTGFLSDHKNDFCCIVAGYEEEVKGCFFAMNKGLERRFPWEHRITDYTTRQLCQIFTKMVNDIEWEVAFEPAVLEAVIERHKHLFKNAGGDIETFLSKCKIFHARRVFCLSKDHKFILTKQDIIDALEYLNSTKKKEEGPPPGMYT
jgi:SpoVK/Ycf46/Vps4 family AAA+-type ATPase